MTYTQVVKEGLKESDSKFHALYNGTPILTGSVRPMIQSFLRSFASSIKQSVIEEIEGKIQLEDDSMYARMGDGHYPRECIVKAQNELRSELHTLLEAMKKEAV